MADTPDVLKRLEEIEDSNRGECDPDCPTMDVRYLLRLTRALLESQGELLEKLKWVRVTVADYQRAFGSTPPEVAMLDRLDAAVAKAKAVRRGEGL